jgi:hypothetical protein
MLLVALDLLQATCLTRLVGFQHELCQNIPVKAGTLHTVEALCSPSFPPDVILALFRGGGTCDRSLVVMLTK